ncbi:putative transcriptional regulator [Listeria grandensis FSL F6-0971]|uniref:Putative transcriptional regulator n=1 Tax=Listeria grandensis FSL F6-0971 TaxID=1265819 RepID=W7BP25_9LIST|nr:Crp/Fnr family transcriptional regulator [Listeria grandensis]EUJ24781.1 putative transcriptional regulator [Listeria grandensis FSL F6-0971]
MYSGESFPNFKKRIDTLKLLKADVDFGEFCYEKRIKKGEVLTQKIIGDNLFAIESGVVKFGYMKEQEVVFQHFLEPMEFVILPEYSEELPAECHYQAVTDIVGWEIDFLFFQRALTKEDPHNLILMQHFFGIRVESFSERLSVLI